ncbi:UNVERIFIED_CONTAM: hypothetical protein FKN15_032356 [Acipenser sinensis]
MLLAFLASVQRVPARPCDSCCIAEWSLNIVLEGLTKAPLEPLHFIELKYLSLKTAFLLAITYVKRMIELQIMAPTYTADDRIIITIPLGKLKDLQRGEKYIPETFSSTFSDSYKLFLNGQPKALGMKFSFALNIISSLWAAVAVCLTITFAANSSNPPPLEKDSVSRVLDVCHADLTFLVYIVGFQPVIYLKQDA